MAHIKVQFLIVLLSLPNSLMLSLPFTFSDQNSYGFSSVPLPSNRPARLMLPRVITVRIYSESTS